MSNLYKLMFLSTLISGTLLTISSYSMMSMWMGLEINLLSIIPLMSNSKNQLTAEAAMKYFIVQAIASSILLFSMIMISNINPLDYMKNSNLGNMILTSSLLMKTGAAPFHFWFPEIIDGLEWMNVMIMLTWQKIAPMMVMFSTSQSNNLISLAIIISMIVGGTMGINQTSLRKILTYSSINHIGWMLACLKTSITLWLAYFVVYALVSFNLILILKSYKLFYTMQLYSHKNNLLKMSILSNFLSLGGVPPFLGFLPKWIILHELAPSNIVLAMTMAILTLITLFFYLRLMLPSMTLSSTVNKTSSKTNTKFVVWWSNWINLSSLVLCTVWFNLT